MANGRDKGEKRGESSDGADGVASRKTRAPRDPEGRKRAIARAAADIIMNDGVSKVTHRRVAELARVPLGSTTAYFKSIDDLKRAGVVRLAEGMGDYYAGMAERMRAGESSADAVARYINEYLADAERVNADVAFYAASFADAELRELAHGSYESTIEAFEAFADRDRAEVLYAFLDGLITTTALRGKPLAPDLVAKTVKMLLG